MVQVETTLFVHEDGPCVEAPRVAIATYSPAAGTRATWSNASRLGIMTSRPESIQKAEPLELSDNSPGAATTGATQLGGSGITAP